MNNSVFKIVSGLIVAGISLALSGCETRIADFTALSSKNIDWSHASEFQHGATRVQGKDSFSIIIFIPTKGQVNVKEAVDKAIETTPGAVALVDGAVYHYGYWFIFGEEGVRVEGTPLIDPRLISNHPRPLIPKR